MAWISVVNWRQFQHYDPSRRQPPWIKVYVDLLDNDDYLKLTARQRAILHGIWMLYAASRCRLSASPALLTARLGLGPSTAHGGLAEGSSTAHGGLVEGSARANARLTRGEGPVRTRDITALCNAGFLRIVASKELAEGYQVASKALASRAPAHSQETEEENYNYNSPEYEAFTSKGEALAEYDHRPLFGSDESDSDKSAAEDKPANASLRRESQRWKTESDVPQLGEAVHGELERLQGGAAA